MHSSAKHKHNKDWITKSWPQCNQGWPDSENQKPGIWKKKNAIDYVRITILQIGVMTHDKIRSNWMIRIQEFRFRLNGFWTFHFAISFFKAYYLLYISECDDLSSNWPFKFIEKNIYKRWVNPTNPKIIIYKTPFLIINKGG